MECHCPHLLSALNMFLNVSLSFYLAQPRWQEQGPPDPPMETPDWEFVSG